MYHEIEAFGIAVCAFGLVFGLTKKAINSAMPNTQISRFRNTTTDGEFNMSTLLLILQGGLVGVVAGWAYPDCGWQFWAICVANPVLTVGYAIAKKMED